MNTPTSEFSPPMINGVSASKVHLPKLKDSPNSIFEYLCQAFSHISPSEWEQRFHDQLIYAANGTILSIQSPYQPNSHVFYYRFLAHEIQVPFQHHIIFENEHLLVVDKPHFLTMSPTGQYVQETLLVRLKKQTQNENLTPIHRLDRETAGIVLFSKTPESRHLYQQMFADRSVKKTYHAIARYQVHLNFPRTVKLKLSKGHPFYTMQIQEGEPNTETDIDILQIRGQFAKYKLCPLTGKQHQLRVHLASLGIPILHDPFYPTVKHKAEDDFSQPLQLLAKSIQFTDPFTQEEMFFESVQDLFL